MTADVRLRGPSDLAVRRQRLASLPGAVESRCMALDVCAHITGTVWKIVVEQGQSVTEEQQLVILESMKMEMPVEAPEAGVVEEIVVEEGQTVEEGDVLVRLAT